MIRYHTMFCTHLTLIVLMASSISTHTAADERWQKIDAQGASMPDHEGPWLCVLDHQTGLLWENKSDNEGLHYASATYSWYSPTPERGKAASGSCRTQDGQEHGCDTHELVRTAQRERWCDRSDWRLPSTQELDSLLYDTGIPGAPRIATGFFPHTGIVAYWTADLIQPAETEAMLINFGDGRHLALPLDRVARVRLVAGGNTTSHRYSSPNASDEYRVKQ